MKFCKNCGKELNENILFCPCCGTKCSTQTNENVVPPVTEKIKNTKPSTSNSPIKILGYTFFILSICAVVFLGGYYILFGNPVKKILHTEKEPSGPDNNAILQNDVYQVSSDIYEEDINDANGHDYVEMTSFGPKWAVVNIGANSPTDVGYTFMWGDCDRYADGNTYKYLDVSKSCLNHDKIYDNYRVYTKYTVDESYRHMHEDEWEPICEGEIHGDGKTHLELSDDPARQVWGGKWRTPSVSEVEDLIKSCRLKRDVMANSDGQYVDVVVLTSKVTGNTLIIPSEDCWTSDLGTEIEDRHEFNKERHQLCPCTWMCDFKLWIFDSSRIYKTPIRAVLDD